MVHLLVGTVANAQGPDGICSVLHAHDPSVIEAQTSNWNEPCPMTCNTQVVSPICIADQPCFVSSDCHDSGSFLSGKSHIWGEEACHQLRYQLCGLLLGDAYAVTQRPRTIQAAGMRIPASDGDVRQECPHSGKVLDMLRSS